MKPFDLEKKLKKLLSNTFKEYSELFHITPPPPHIKSDASTNFALILSKKINIPIDEVTKELTLIFEKEKLKTEINSGFVNIEFPKELYASYLNIVINQSQPFIKEENKSKKVIIEFVSANPTGPLHLASASGASIGDSISNILKELGYNVHKEYYVNDCGKQINLLGQSLLARYLAKDPPEEGYHGEYLFDIAKILPQQAKEWAENNDIKKFSDFAVKVIIKQQKEDLEKLGVEFDRWFYESEIHEQGLPNKILEMLKTKGAIEEKDGALWLKTEDALDKERVLKKSDGTNTYFLNDLAYHWTKYERGFDKIIDIWGADHHGYISRMKAGIRLLGLDEKKFTVLIHQLVSLKKGNDTIKMSKRAGRFYTLRQLIEETSKDAVRFFFTMRSPNTHLVFDTELAKRQSIENPLYYVQYAHARISSIIRNANEKKINTQKSDFEDYTLTEDDKTILRQIFWFERILEQCEKDLSPHHLTLYLIELAKEFHKYYERNRVIDENQPIRSASRIFILKGVKRIIQKGLEIIGVSAPDSM